MESKEPDFEWPKSDVAETTPPAVETPPPPISSSSGVEDVPKSVEPTSEPPTTTTAKPTEGILSSYIFKLWIVHMYNIIMSCMCTCIVHLV